MIRSPDGTEKIAWKSTKGSQHKLNAGTLVPEEYAEIKASHQQHHHAHHHSDNNQNHRGSFNENSREEDDRSVTDIVVLYDFPWQHPPEEYGIALTGKAFNHLLTSPNPAS